MNHWLHTCNNYLCPEAFCGVCVTPALFCGVSPQVPGGHPQSVPCRPGPAGLARRSCCRSATPCIIFRVWELQLQAAAHRLMLFRGCNGGMAWHGMPACMPCTKWHSACKASPAPQLPLACPRSRPLQRSSIIIRLPWLSLMASDSPHAALGAPPFPAAAANRSTCSHELMDEEAGMMGGMA